MNYVIIFNDKEEGDLMVFKVRFQVQDLTKTFESLLPHDDII